jgi:hypothetical protein
VVFVVPGYAPREDETETETGPVPGQRLLPAPRRMFKNAAGVWEAVPED